MSIQHALLISLTEKPSSGYELARRFDRSIGYFWHATHQQIYRELGRMAEAAWIAAQDEGIDGRNRKKVYEVLPEGRAELIRWVLEPGTGYDQRDEILVKVRAEAALGPLGLGAELRRLIDEHSQRLATYLEIERRDFSGPDMDRAQTLRYALLKRGISVETGWIAWANDLLPLLDEAAR